MDILKPPGPMNFNAANAADAWDKWAAGFKNYFKAAELMKEEADVQVAILLVLAGPDSLAIHNTFHYYQGEDKGDYEIVLRKVSEYIVDLGEALGTRDTAFGNVTKPKGETIDQWLIELREPPCANSAHRKRTC